MTSVRITFDYELSVRWEPDWEVGSHVREYPDAYDAEPDSCELAYVDGPRGEVLASLGCIDDADDNYRREIEAELLAEAESELRRLYGAGEESEQ